MMKHLQFDPSSQSASDLKAFSDPISIKPKPFLRWAGGKSAIAREILPLLDKNRSTYYEPFIGAGSIFLLNSAFQSAHLGDLNQGLVEVFEVIRDDLKEFVDFFSKLPQSKDDYYLIRAWDRDPGFRENYSKIERAARFVYLNMLCFNGLYRENSSGNFNVPLSGTRMPRLLDIENLRLVSRKLSARAPSGELRVSIRHGDYLLLTSTAKAGDVVYFDPPYAPISLAPSFVAYQPKGFTNEDQQRLRDEALRLTEKGVRVVLSNSNAPLIRSLYHRFDTRVVMKNRTISGRSYGRKAVEELIIDNRSMLIDGKFSSG